MDRGSAVIPPRHMHRLQGEPAVVRSRASRWRAPAGPQRACGTSSPERRAISLHTAAPPPHGLAATNPGSALFVPCHNHPQRPQGFDPRISAGGTP